MSEGRLCKVCECIVTIYTCMNSWKEPFNTYNSSIWISSLFWLLNWFQACFQMDTIVVSRQQPPYCLCKKSSSSYERIKNKQVTELLSNQRVRKRYTVDSHCLELGWLKSDHRWNIRSLTLTFLPLNRLFHMFISQSVKLITDNIWIGLVLWHRLDVYNQDYRFIISALGSAYINDYEKYKTEVFLSIELFVGN